MWILKREVQGSQNEKSYYLIVGEHLVGRKDCQIQVTGDQSVSRKHAWITVCQKENDKAQVTLKDVSKFGCLVNDVKCQNSLAVILKHDDKITFGTQNSSYRLKYEPLVLFASCLDNAKKKILKSQLGKLGGYMVNEWQKECSHLVMEALSFTVKVIYALVTCCPIVTPLYFDDLLQVIDTNAAELPPPEKYMPPIKEDLIDQEQVSFHPNAARKTVFAGKLFLFMEKKQHKRLEHAIILAGGKSSLKETGDISGSDDDILTDENTLVMSVNLNLGISEKKEMWISHVGDVLRNLNRRPIAETEVGLAILHVSLDQYCNTSLNHVPKIAKQIVSKSISTMEEMSQRINQSPEKKPFSLGIVGQKPNSIVTTPQDSRKRFRNGSDASQPMVFETPDSRSVEFKRRKLSAMDITHVSQTQQSLIKTPGVPQGSSPAKKPISPTDKQFHEARKECSSVSKADTTHISQSEIISESPSGGQKRKSSSPDNITHISQSQVSPNEGEQRDNSSQRRLKKLRLSRSNADVTHISQSQFPPNEEKSSNISRNAHEITHISQSQLSQKDVKPTNNLSTGVQRPKPSTSENEVSVIPESQTSTTEVKVQETPSPEISFTTKRRKISSPTSEVTHISNTERSMVAESQNISPSPISSSTKPIVFDNATSPPVNKSLAGALEERSSDRSRDLENTARNFSSKGDKETELRKFSGIKDVKRTSAKSNGSSLERTKDTSCIDQVIRENTTRVQDLTDVKSRGTPSGVGWMSKKSIRVKNENLDINHNVSASGGRGFEDLNAASPKNDDSQKQSHSKQDQKVPEPAVVKKEETIEFPSDLMCVQHIELVVAKSVRPKTQQSEKKYSTTLKNMKKFRKQNCASNEKGLPRMIGGTDLVVFTSTTGDEDGWVSEVQAMNQQDQEDREADKLFRYEPDTKQRKRR